MSAAGGASFRARLLGGETLVGTLLAIPSPEVTEIVARAGFDWLFVDGEHGPFGARELLATLRAAGTTPCLVRTPVGDDAAIGRALDAGAAGVIVPQVHDAEQAARVAALAHYPPAGARGVGVTRSGGYGGRGAAELAAANDATVVVVQAESARAVEQVDAIVRAPGVDAVLVGPNDLAASLGHPGRMDHPEVQRAIARVIDACRAAGRAAGIFGASAAAVRPWVERGARLVVAGVDALLLGEGARALRASLDALPALDAPGRG